MLSSAETGATFLFHPWHPERELTGEETNP
jgi:hypothetical protein